MIEVEQMFLNLPEEPEQRRNKLVSALNQNGLFIYNGAQYADRAAIARLIQESFDVVIAGGGPAGLHAACQLSKRGIRTLLIEKALLLDTNNTIGLPDTIVQEFDLQTAISRYHQGTFFRDYLGMNFESKIDYCIMDQTKVLFLLASRIDPKYCTLIENCEITAYARTKAGTLDIKTVFNDYRLMHYRNAAQVAPRALGALQLDRNFYEKYDPYVRVNLFDELDARRDLTKGHFDCKILVEAAGYASSIAKAFHRQKRCKVWKCLVYDFENVAGPQKEIIWDLAIPTETSANFWVDVCENNKVSAGIMVLTRTTPAIPDGYPPKSALEEYMSKWLSIRHIQGKFVRERYGVIPMTDFREPAAFDNIIFIGVSSSRQIPNTGFGFFPALREAILLGNVVEESLKEKDYSQNFLRRYDIEWLRKNEQSMAFDIALQDFHYAYRRDEYFHEFAQTCTQVPQRTVKQRICTGLSIQDLVVFARVFIGHQSLLCKQRIENGMYEKIVTDIGRFLYCLFSQKLRFYQPEGNPIFNYELPRHGLLGSCWRSLDIVVRRKIPEFFCRQVTRLMFQRLLQPLLRAELKILFAFAAALKRLFHRAGKTDSEFR